MSDPLTEFQIVPLVPNLELPRRASPKTRSDVPTGYGIQEQCLPFTAASALGFLIPSPIHFGHCPDSDVPKGCRSFRSLLPVAGPYADWVFYVQDDPRCNFSANAYSLIDLPSVGPILEPGISFFDREDQQDMFKLHLPYIWRTPPEIDTLFVPLLNRKAHSFEVQSGLVETSWYSNPVNMVLRKAPKPVHVDVGQDVAQAILISRKVQGPQLEVAASHSRLTREIRKLFVEWHAQHATDRSAYKILAHGGHRRTD